MLLIYIYIAYYSISLQFLKTSPIILPNMPIILVRNESSHYTKQCHDYSMMYDFAWSKIS